MAAAKPKRAGGIEWTPANVVTTIRIALIPLFMVLMLAPWAAALVGEGAAAADLQAWTCLALYALIALTDSLDGYLARSRNEVTVFGKFMDPIADKVLVMAALIVLVEFGSCPSWVPVVILTRELLVSGLRMLVASAGVVVAASWIGKAKTFTTMVAIGLFIVVDAPSLAGVHHVLFPLAWVLMVAAVVLTVVSMVDYFAKSWPLLTEDGSHGAAGAGEAEAAAVEQAAQVAPATVSAASVPAPDAVAPADTHGFAAPIPAELALEGAHAQAEPVVRRAVAAGKTVACAESCTGGLVAAALTSVAGSSACVAGGVVSYAVEVKEAVLGVPAAVVEEHGVVSVEVAEAMALGAAVLLGTDLAVATTGVAGPGGGDERTPVGTVCLAVARRAADGSLAVRSERARFAGDRAQVRAQATDRALTLLAAELG
jgi:CDP-diacylglycerol--glycerol-3-phosphate 3-phosphatidyltransferase